MDWQRRYFKGKEVWVQVDHLGNPLAEQGRVPMRYQNDDEAKVYHASLRNLSDKPADLEDAEADFEKSSRSPRKKSGTKSPTLPITKAESPEPRGPRRESHQVPPELADEVGPDTGIVEIYTDGACSGNPGPSGYGFVMRDGDTYREVSQYLGLGTNNIAELTAIKEALLLVEDKTRPVRLYTDSSYSIGVLTKGWKAKANQELIYSIRALVDEFSDLELRKVKGHSGHPLNERADYLATSSLEDREA